MERARFLDRACFDNDRSLTKESQEQPWDKQHLIGDNITEGQQGNPLTDGDLERLVSLIRRSADQSTLRTLSAALDAEIQSLTRQVATVRSNLGIEFRRKSHRWALESEAGLTAADNSRTASLP